ncbi:histidine phosphatase family protein [Streptomyces sp. NPDC056716]|uniref:histidine phosphatase family protein n=1 Tax=unclassified Streptomyces TaxID=2593676 RepID=UPI0036A8EAA0
MRLILIRHGQTGANVDMLLDTAFPGAGLTDLGRRQAAALPGALAAEDIGAVYASTLTRTQDTAAPLAAARGLDVRVRDGIRELAAGDLELLPGWSPDGERYMRTVVAWMNGDTALRMPGGESGDEALARYDAVVAEAAASGAGTVAMVSHGAAIRLWTVVRSTGVDAAFAAAHGLQNTGIVLLEGTPQDGFKALSWEGAAPGLRGEGGPTGRPVDPGGPGLRPV